MRIGFGSDHAGVTLKRELLGYVASLGHDVTDLGTDGFAPVDYPTYAFAVAEGVAGGTFDRGILVCGSGLGMSIAANKVPGIRAALCADDSDQVLGAALPVLHRWPSDDPRGLAGHYSTGQQGQLRGRLGASLTCLLVPPKVTLCQSAAVRTSRLHGPRGQRHG